MNENTHTPEPWTVCSTLDRFPGIEARTVRTSVIIYGEEDEDCGVRGDTPEISLANAQRIITCVNGCKGIQDPENTVPEMARALEACALADELSFDDFVKRFGFGQGQLADYITEVLAKVTRS